MALCWRNLRYVGRLRVLIGELSAFALSVIKVNTNLRILVCDGPTHTLFNGPHIVICTLKYFLQFRPDVHNPRQLQHSSTINMYSPSKLEVTPAGWNKFEKHLRLVRYITLIPIFFHPVAGNPLI